jgi:hypothetical protein
MLIPRLGKPPVRQYRKSGVIVRHTATPAKFTYTPDAGEEVRPITPQRLPDFIRAFKLVGHVGTIRADRRDAQLMLQYARARAREDAKQ